MNDVEKEAFIQAYNSHVAVADEKVVRLFLDAKESDEESLYEKYSCDYTSIMDAFGMWGDAIKFCRENAIDKK